MWHSLGKCAIFIFFAVGVSKIFKKSCNWCMFRWFIDYEKNVNELRMSKIMLTISPRSLPRLSKWFHFIHRLVPPRGEITFWGSTFNRQNVASGSRIVKNELLMFNKENKPAIPLDWVFMWSAFSIAVECQLVNKNWCVSICFGWAAKNIFGLTNLHSEMQLYTTSHETVKQQHKVETRVLKLMNP